MLAEVVSTYCHEAAGAASAFGGPEAPDLSIVFRTNEVLGFIIFI